jgi:twitching motility protein PilI
MNENSLANPLMAVGQGGAQSAAITTPSSALPTQSYLKFNLGMQAALIPTKQVQEAITIPTARITPMPNMPPALLGLINRRSRVLWVIDLALLLGLQVAYPNTQQYNLVLMQVGAILLGLRVHAVEGIVSLPAHRVQPPPAHVPNSLVPFLKGCVLQEREVLLVLDPEAILRSPALQEH